MFGAGFFLGKLASVDGGLELVNEGAARKALDTFGQIAGQNDGEGEDVVASGEQVGVA